MVSRSSAVARCSDPTEAQVKVRLRQVYLLLRVVSVLLTRFSADRSGPSDDGNQTCGVMIHKELLFGGEPVVSLIFWVSMCYTLIRRGELKRLSKVPRIINGGP
jgi:hypothetical protein